MILVTIIVSIICGISLGFAVGLVGVCGYWKRRCEYLGELIGEQCERANYWQNRCEEEGEIEDTTGG